MKTIPNKAFEAAKNEWLSFFWATTHVGGSIRFVGFCWEDGGFRIDENGNPTCDIRGNTVANYAVETLDATNKQHVAQCEEWYNG